MLTGLVLSSKSCLFFHVAVDFNTQSLFQIFSHLSEMLLQLFLVSGNIVPFGGVGGIMHHHTKGQTQKHYYQMFFLFVDYRFYIDA